MNKADGVDHINALEIGLSHERERLAAAKNANEIALRKVWVRQYEKEIADTKAYIGIVDAPATPMSDDDLMAELSA